MSQRENDGSQPSPSSGAGGYRNPPKERRFKTSGNPKGRPKGSKNRKTIVRSVADEMHSVQENGKRRRLSTLELVLLRLRNLALQGDNVRAFDEIHRLAKAYQPQQENDNVGYLVVPAPMTEEEYAAEQEERNKTRKPPPGYEFTDASTPE